MDSGTPHAVSTARKRLQRSLSLSMEGDGQGLLPNPFLHPPDERATAGETVHITSSDLYQVQKKANGARGIRTTRISSPPSERSRRGSVPQLPPVNGAVELDSSSRTSIASINEHTVELVLSRNNTSSSLEEHVATLQVPTTVVRHPPKGRYGRRVSSPAIFPLEKNHAHPIFNPDAPHKNTNSNNLRQKSRKISAKLKQNKSENSLLQTSWPLSRSPVWSERHVAERIEEGVPSNGSLGGSNKILGNRRKIVSPSFSSVSGPTTSRNYVFVYNEKKEDDSAPKSMFKVEKQRQNSGDNNNNSSPPPILPLDTEEKEEEMEEDNRDTTYVVPTLEIMQQRDKEMEMLVAESSKTDRIVNWLIGEDCLMEDNDTSS